MAQTTTIEWTRNSDGTPGSTYNPVRGCSRISPGCGGGLRGPNGESGGCYAEGIAARFSGEGQPFHGFAEMTEHGPRWTGKVELIQRLLAAPLRRKKPTTYFCSMFDLFHERLSNESIAAVFGVMSAAHRHTFQVLTKRSERMREWFAWVDGQIDAAAAAGTPRQMLAHAGVCVYQAVEAGLDARLIGPVCPPWPLPNVHLGVSVELAKYKTRFDDLRACPAVVRFASLEPLLGDLGALDLTGIHQVIAGAESGHGARAMHEDWVRSIRDQAKAQGVAMFYKQKLNDRGHKVSLPMLDGRTWDEMPTVRA